MRKHNIQANKKKEIDEKQCLAKTKNGNTCQRKAKKGQDYCGIHLKKNKEKEEKRFLKGVNIYGIVLLLATSFLIYVSTIKVIKEQSNQIFRFLGVNTTTIVPIIMLFAAIIGIKLLKSKKINWYARSSFFLASIIIVFSASLALNQIQNNFSFEKEIKPNEKNHLIKEDFEIIENLHCFSSKYVEAVYGDKLTCQIIFKQKKYSKYNLTNIRINDETIEIEHINYGSNKVKEDEKSTLVAFNIQNPLVENEQNNISFFYKKNETSNKIFLGNVQTDMNYMSASEAANIKNEKIKNTVSFLTLSITITFGAIFVGIKHLRDIIEERK
ncbi:hypothetical protein JXA48_00110 [Candidatus Woesearchaeota archaeon]|nr:hypothetical protein [Candidatus Woesearchaeota archaeon]